MNMLPRSCAASVRHWHVRPGRAAATVHATMCTSNTLNEQLWCLHRYGQCKQTAQEILDLVEECNNYTDTRRAE
jgi:hypothetical protein